MLVHIKKSKIFLLVILFCSKIYALDFSMKSDVKLAIPITFENSKLNYSSLSPILDLGISFPVLQNLEVTTTISWMNGKFKEGIFKKQNYGYYNFFSVLAGIGYKFDLKQGISLIPKAQIGYSYALMNLNSGGKYEESLFCGQVALDVMKSFTDNLAIYGTTSFDYYSLFCPIGFGIGAMYKFY